MLSALSAPFLPTLHGWEDGEETVLVLEDLSATVWPPPYPSDTAPLFEVLAAAAALPPPPSLRPLTGRGRAWSEVALDPEPFLRLGLCSREWFDRAAQLLAEAERRADLSGNRLVHFDVWSGNVCFSGRGPILVDWAEARRGNADVDVAFAVLSVLAEGGRLPSAVGLTDEAAWATYLAGDLALRAPQPLPDWAEPGSTLQDDLRGDLVHALRWAAAALELPPPDVSSATTGTTDSDEVVPDRPQ